VRSGPVPMDLFGKRDDCMEAHVKEDPINLSLSATHLFTPAETQLSDRPSSSSFHPSVSEVDCAPLAQLTTRSRRDGLRADHNDSTVGDVIPISIMFRVIADMLAIRYRDAFVENGFTNLAA
jgi:hypothetical protein